MQDLDIQGTWNGTRRINPFYPFGGVNSATQQVSFEINIVEFDRTSAQLNGVIIGDSGSGFDGFIIEFDDVFGFNHITQNAHGQAVNGFSISGPIGAGAGTHRLVVRYDGLRSVHASLSSLATMEDLQAFLNSHPPHVPIPFVALERK